MTTRRLAAILAADVVGRDEEGTLRLLKASPLTGRSIHEFRTNLVPLAEPTGEFLPLVLGRRAKGHQTNDPDVRELFPVLY
jgi:hypothetical protein